MGSADPVKLSHGLLASEHIKGGVALGADCPCCVNQSVDCLAGEETSGRKPAPGSSTEGFLMRGADDVTLRGIERFAEKISGECGCLGAVPT